MAVGNLTFSTGGWVLAGNTITLAPSPPAPLPEGEGSNWPSQTSSSAEGAASVVVVADGVTTIACPISGSLVKDGAGGLTLGGGLEACSALTVDNGVLDLGGATLALSSVTLTGGSLVNGTLDVATALDLYSGTVSADLGGTAELEKFGAGTVLLTGNNTYGGGTNVLAGTLTAAYAQSLPAGTMYSSSATGQGTVVVQPTLYWSGSGSWTAGPWQLADGTPTPWIDGSSVVIAAGSVLAIDGLVNVGAITIAGDATIAGGTLALPSGGTTINVLSGTTLISSAIAGGGLTEAGTGTLVLDGAVASAPVVDGGRAIGPGAVFANDGESLANIDPAMFSLVQSLFVDQAIDRTDMIQILQGAAVNGGVTASALEALQVLTLPQNEARLNLPDYVAVLAGDVVNGNPANAFYQGQPLGNLADQGSAGGDVCAGAAQLRATALTDLIGKWFYGTDLPAIDSTANGWGASYSVVAGSPFGSAQAPSSADIAQGGLGDCYLISALGAIADSSPSAIASMIIDNGVENGMHTWTVRFYYGGPAGYVADYVTVSALLPAYSGGYLVYAKASAAGGWWLPLVEKAYAEWNATGHEGRDGQNAYASLNGGDMQAVDAQVLGRAAATYCPLAGPAAEQAVVAAIQGGAAVTAAIFSNGDARFNQLGLVTGHAYMVAGYDSDPASPTFGTFQLKNPWGFDEPTAALTWGDLCLYCQWFAVGEAAQVAELTGSGRVRRGDSRRGPAGGGKRPAECGDCGGLLGG